MYAYEGYRVRQCSAVCASILFGRFASVRSYNLFYPGVNRWFLTSLPRAPVRASLKSSRKEIWFDVVHSQLSQPVITVNYHNQLSQPIITASYHSPLSQPVITANYQSLPSRFFETQNSKEKNYRKIWILFFFQTERKKTSIIVKLKLEKEGKKVFLV